MFSSQIYSSWKNIQEEKYKAVLQYFPSALSGRILDIGSGKNWFEEFLANNSIDANIVSIDIERPAGVIASGNELPFKDSSFDRIVSIDAIHLIKSNDFSRVLKKGGLAMFTIFFNNENYSSRKKFIEEKLSALEIISNHAITGRENEYMVLAKK